MSAPTFHAGSKLAWIEQVGSDRNNSDFAVRVAIAISRRVKGAGEAFDASQLSIAAFIGGTERGVRKATKTLQENGHLEIELGGCGRGIAARYRLIMKRRNGGSGDDVPETRNDGSGIEGGMADKTQNGGSGINSGQTPETRNSHSGNIEALNPERRSKKPGTVVPPLPYKSPIKNPCAGARADENHRSSDPLQVSWRAIRKELEARLGADKVRVWLDPLTVEKIDETEIIFGAPTKFFATYNFTNHEQLLLSAWRSVQPSLNRLRFHVNGQSWPRAAGGLPTTAGNGNGTGEALDGCQGQAPSSTAADGATERTSSAVIAASGRG